MSNYIFPPLPPDPPPSAPPPPPPNQAKQDINNSVPNWNLCTTAPPPLNPHSDSFRPPQQLNQQFNPRSFYKPRWPGRRQHRYHNPPRHNSNPRFPNDTPAVQNSKKRKPTEHLELTYTLEEAERAIKLERKYQEEANKHYIKITFPDIEFNRKVAMSLHENIENVHFYNSHEPRVCLVKIHEEYDRDEVIRELNATKFACGVLFAEKKFIEQNSSPLDIIPLSLYVTQLDDNITEEDLKKLYPKSVKITIKFEKRNKNHDKTKTARVDFSKVEHALEAFEGTFWSELRSKKINVRFYNNKASHGMPSDIVPSKVQKTSESDSIHGHSSCTDNQEEEINRDKRVKVKEEPREEPSDDSMSGLSMTSSSYASSFMIKDEPDDSEPFESDDLSSSIFSESQPSPPMSDIYPMSNTEESDFDYVNEEPDVKNPFIRNISSTNIGLTDNNDKPVDKILIKPEPPDEEPDADLNSVPNSSTPNTAQTKVTETDSFDNYPPLSGIRVKKEFSEPFAVPNSFADSSDFGLTGLTGNNTVSMPVIEIKSEHDECDSTTKTDFPDPQHINEECNDEENDPVLTYYMDDSEEEDQDIDDLLRNFERKREMRRKLEAIFKS